MLRVVKPTLTRSGDNKVVGERGVELITGPSAMWVLMLTALSVPTEYGPGYILEFRDRKKSSNGRTVKRWGEVELEDTGAWGHLNGLKTRGVKLQSVRLCRWWVIRARGWFTITVVNTVHVSIVDPYLRAPFYTLWPRFLVVKKWIGVLLLSLQTLGQNFGCIWAFAEFFGFTMDFFIVPWMVTHPIG